MIQALVVELDEALRSLLSDVLADYGHYAVTEVTTEQEALDCLTAAPEGMVVLWSNRDPDHHRTAAFFAAVVADEHLALRHQYILLSTNPDNLPERLQAHLTQLHAPVLAKPFDMDTLLAAMKDAAARLLSQVSTSSPNWRYPTPGTDAQA